MEDNRLIGGEGEGFSTWGSLNSNKITINNYSSAVNIIIGAVSIHEESGKEKHC